MAFNCLRHGAIFTYIKDGHGFVYTRFIHASRMERLILLLTAIVRASRKRQLRKITSRGRHKEEV